MAKFASTRPVNTASDTYDTTTNKRRLVAGTFAVSALFSATAKAENSAPVSAPGALPPERATTDDGAPLAAIEVTAAALYQDLDRPQLVDTIDQGQLTEQGITRLQDALSNVPGLTLNAGEGGAHGDAINLRGLSLPDSFFLDGLRDTGQYQRDTFNLESVDVLLGPSSVQFGWGSTAGVVNAVSKKPGRTPSASADIAVGTADRIRGTGDLNLPFGSAAAARVSLMDEHSGVAGRDIVRNHRTGVAPALSLGIGTDNRFTLSLLHQGQDDIPDYGMPLIDGAPAAVDTRNFYGLADYDRTRTDINISTLRFEHDVDGELTLSTSLRAARDEFLYLLSAPHLGNDATPAPAPGTPLADITIFRDQPSSSGTQTHWISRSEIRAHAGTDGAAHEFAAGVEFSRQSADVSRLFNGIDSIAPTPLIAPDPYEAVAANLTPLGRTRSTASDAAIYVSDSIAWDSRWEVDASVRADRVESRLQEDSTASAFERTDRQLSPRAALVYRPDAAVRYSIAYGASFNPAIDYLNLAPSNSSLSPETDRTFELEARWAPQGGRLSASVAAFDEKMHNARIADPGDPTVQLAPFDQRVRGVEVAMAGRITAGWTFKAGYTHIDARTSATADPLAQGKKVPNTPADAFNLWSTFALDPAWSLAGGIRYVGHRYADTQNTAGVPAYVIANAMASYRADRHWRFQLNADNLANKHYFNSVYYAAADENHAVPGAGRTLIFTARFDY